MIPQFPPDSIASVKQLLSQPRRICITTHHKPDGDAMGSSLALYNYLKTNGHDVVVVAPSDYPDFLEWMPGNEFVVNFDHHKDECISLIGNAEVIFCLDFNAVTRMEKLGPFVARSTAVKVLIDHHLDPESFCDHEFSYPTSCATCEILFHFINALEYQVNISTHVASCLYAGIMTDTGSFRFSSMTADTHKVVASLIQAGASNFTIHEAVYDNFSEARTRFLGYCLIEKLVVIPEFRTAYISITHEELERFGHQTGDTEGIVNYALGIKGIRLAAFFCEKDGMIKISFRSKDQFSVKELSATHFNGGGHTNAAGGRSFDSLDATIKKFTDLLPKLERELNQ